MLYLVLPELELTFNLFLSIDEFKQVSLLFTQFCDVCLLLVNLRFIFSLEIFHLLFEVDHLTIICFQGVSFLPLPRLFFNLGLPAFLELAVPQVFDTKVFVFNVSLDLLLAIKQECCILLEPLVYILQTVH